MESDLGTRLDWISIAHWNTDKLLVHLVARGVANDGPDLVISRDYISHGLRSRVTDLVSAELGPGCEHEIRRCAVSPPADCRASSPIIGRLVATGLHDELTGQAYGVDGRAYHMRLRGIDAFADAPPAGGIVEMRRFGGPSDPRPTLVLANRSDIDLDRQVTAPGATWLDYRRVERQRMPLAMSGVGQEVRDAMEARAEHLAADVLARRQGPKHRPAARPPRHAAAPRTRRRRRRAVGRDRDALHAGPRAARSSLVPSAGASR